MDNANDKIIGNILNFLQDGVVSKINHTDSFNFINSKDDTNINDLGSMNLDRNHRNTDQQSNGNEDVEQHEDSNLKSNVSRNDDDGHTSCSWWKPWTTKLLLLSETKSNSSSLAIAETNSLPAMDVCDHVFGISFWKQLKKELCESSFLLEPSKHLRIPTRNRLGGGRMDRALFIGRDLRQQPTFATSYPKLHHFIHHIEHNIIQQLSKAFFQGENSNDEIDSKYVWKVDKSLTSVQLATYPGDSISGYVRHCDVSGKCCPPTISSANMNDTHSQSHNQSQRIITAVYYLTELDWDETEDGGCLRVFYPDGKQYWDVAPYADRLVLFRSDLVEHQVLPSHKRKRIALTLWIYAQRIIKHTNRKLLNHRILVNFKLYNVVEDDDYLKPYKNLPPLPQYKPSSPTKKDSTTTTSSDAKDGTNRNIIDDLSVWNKEILEGKIFISIPAYRDSETYPTVCSLIANAANPSRVYIGIVWQVNENEDADSCFFTTPLPIMSNTADDTYSWKPDTHLRILVMRHTDATGPCYARYLAQSLYRDETFLLQIDSHMRFRPNWDTYLIQLLLLHSKQNTKEKQQVILSTYPPGYNIDDVKTNQMHCYDTRATILLPWKFDSDGMLRQKGRFIDSSKDDANVDTANEISMNGFSSTIHQHHLYAAGFNFSYANVIQKCPYDGHQLHHLFFGEEISMAVRLFTHGYDIYSPPYTVCYHLWSRKHRPATFQQDIQRKAKIMTNNKNDEYSYWKQARLTSLKKVCEQLRGIIRDDGHNCGLGTLRSVSEFETRLGVDFEKEAIVNLRSRHFDTSDNTSFTTTHENTNIQYEDTPSLIEKNNLIETLINNIS